MRRLLVVVVAVVVLAAAFVAVQLSRSVPAVAASATDSSMTIAGSSSTIAWPTQGQAAVGVEGVGVIDSHNTQPRTALASVTKLMTAYIVLHDHPLTSGAQGPSIAVTSADVSTYRQQLAAGDSVVAVAAGEQLSEMQALEALLIPSGDNIATMLAVWDAGSVKAFVAKMNSTAAQLGLGSTHYVDPSGVAIGTLSTAADQVRLAMDDMTLPTFKTVVAMTQATLPVVGRVYNVDALLGKHGIIGIKTGYTTVAGGCFVFAANATVAGQVRTIVGAVLHQFGTAAQPSALTTAFDASIALLTSAEQLLEQTTVVRAGTTLGHLDVPWAPAVSLVATKTVTFIGLPRERATTTVHLPAKLQAPVPAHTPFGTATVSVGDQHETVPLKTSRALPAASLKWRLTHF